MRRMQFLALAVILLQASVTGAQDPTGSAGSADSAGGLALVDWLIIFVYAASTIGLGWFFSRRQKTTDEYFVGSRKMNPLLIGVSLFATLLSANSYLAFPGEALGKGPVYMTSSFALPLVFLIVGYGVLPIYMRYSVTSAYELLEAKLGLGIRLLGAGMFITLRLIWMSLLIYLMSKAMATILGGTEKWIPYIAIVTGFVAVTYTSLGGLRAVVITDLLQTVLLYGGLLVVIGIVTVDLGGFGWFPTAWQDNWDTQPLASFDPSTRVTVLGSIISVIVWHVCTAGGDQVTVQRFMATKDADAARRAYAAQLSLAVVVSLTLACVGFALLGYYRAHPDRLAQGTTIAENADDIFPQFIASQLPVGVAGLVVAAMFAAAMSSIDSGVNSITAVIMTDGLDRFGRAPKTDQGHVRAARLLAFGIAGFVVTFSSVMQYVPGNFMAITNKTNNLLTTPIFCLFFFALFVPFARPVGVWAGAIVGTVTALLIAYSGPIFGAHPQTGEDPISFQWIGPIALLANITTGCVVSYFLGSVGDVPAARRQPRLR